MPSSPFKILPFTETNLAEALRDGSNSVDEIIESSHFQYFKSYFGPEDDGLNAKTILIEPNYISKSFLIDYSNFYSNCFTDYKRKCKRVHFFKEQISFRKFNSMLSSNKKKDSKLWESYLGYIVVKPLPGLSIGASIVKTYCFSKENPRNFPSTKLYTVNLFGKRLDFKSLAFQQQDSVVGACATSALWSAFHKTSQLFQTPLPSLSDITKSAKNLYTNSGRTFPNAGLDYYQIGNAIENVGLVSELRNRLDSGDVDYIKAFVYAYNKMGLPILLGINLENLGAHLITVVGYKKDISYNFKKKKGLSLRAERIQRLYVHDDQVGPFSRLTILPDGKLETGWVDKKGKSVLADLVSIIVPLHNKIRLTFENVYARIRFFDLFLNNLSPGIEFNWDISLSFSNDYKAKLYESRPAISRSFKLSILTNPLPKYVWVVKGYVGDECIIDLLYDATQIAAADSLLEIIIFNKSFEETIGMALADQDVKDFISQKLGTRFLKLLESAANESFT